MVEARYRHLPASLRDMLGPMLPALFPPGMGARGGRPPVPDLVCLDAVVDIAKGTRWRDIRRASHGVSRDTVLRGLRFRAAFGGVCRHHGPFGAAAGGICGRAAHGRPSGTRARARGTADRTVSGTAMALPPAGDG